MKFKPMPKIPRLEREIIITEKIDGTNANILIQSASTIDMSLEGADIPKEHIVVNGHYVTAGSRTRWLTSDSKGDNFDFCKWVQKNAERLVRLGDGHHFGEWWGRGIQREYDLKERRFSLFNVNRWTRENLTELGLTDIVYTVPHLMTLKDFDKQRIDDIIWGLKESGSIAAPGFMKPEGVVIYHTASRQLYKKTLEHDAEGKGE